MIEIDTEDLTKSTKHYKDVRYTRGGNVFTRRQLVGSEIKTQWNTKINDVSAEMVTQAQRGQYSPTKASGLKEMAKQADRLLEISKFLYDVKKQAEDNKK